jgi:hypothetical protein
MCARSIIRFDAGVLAYDSERNKLQGRPCSLVYTHGRSTDGIEPEQNARACVWFADDSMTQLFVCGGNFTSQLLHMLHESRDAALLDITSVRWTDLPMMPEYCGGSAAASFRIPLKPLFLVAVIDMGDACST